MAKTNEPTGWIGWIAFAGFMMILQGVFHAIQGFAALLNDQWLVVTEDQLLLLDFTTWGWVHLLVGIVVLIAGFSIFHGSAWARIVGVLAAVASAVGALASAELYPLWSVVIITIDVLIIYALTVHGEEMRLE